MLQANGQELLAEPYARRRNLLEELFAAYAVGPPWTLCPETDDIRVAQDWLTSWTDVPGVEGVVIRARKQRYLPGARGWYKIRRRDTTEAIIGAITGTLERPQALVLGRRDQEGVLRTVARSTHLHPDQARSIGARLTVARPGHAWEGCVSQPRGSRTRRWMSPSSSPTSWPRSPWIPPSPAACGDTPSDSPGSATT
ncbi:ATP-dependent DNA ligase [Streptomyces sp. NPDC004682]